MYLYSSHKKTIIRHTDTIVVCKNAAQAINLQQILGVEALGAWSCDDPDNYMNPFVEIIDHNGSRILNGNLAYKALQGSQHMKPYRDDEKAVYLEFDYIPDPNSCFSAHIQHLSIIVTTFLSKKTERHF